LLRSLVFEAEIGPKEAIVGQKRAFFEALYLLISAQDELASY
jgi:hypothetical protein